MRAFGLSLLGLCAVAVAQPGVAYADFVCNAKTQRVNVFLEPPAWVAPLEVHPEGDRLKHRNQAPDVWSPADGLKEPFDIVDTLPSGARVKSHALAESKGWIWISFRHSQNGLVGNGYVHVSRLSPISCDADPKLAADLIKMRQYGLENGDYFETGPDDFPLDGMRGAKAFETSMLSGAIKTSRVYVPCEVPKASHARPADLSAARLRVDPYIETCSELLAANPNYVEALIIRGDIYHGFAKSPSPSIDSKSPKWAEDIQHRKDAQALAVADWTRASLLLPKGGPKFPTLLEDRLTPTGAAGYAVK